MKNKPAQLLLIVIFFLLISPVIRAQDTEEEFTPVYVTITTIHGLVDFDFENWKAVEQEYFDKVTSQNELILSHEVLLSYFNPEFAEIKIINVLSSWEDIVEANERRMELIEKAWPDEEERAAFFEKQNSFYRSLHSDEIFLSSIYSKSLVKEPGQNRPFTFMVKTNILGDTEMEDSYNNYKTFAKEVIFKNSRILAYYPYHHFWGADSREFMEVYVFDTFSDVENSIYESNALLSGIVPDETERKKFLTSLYSAIESQKTAFYKNVPSLSK